MRKVLPLLVRRLLLFPEGPPGLPLGTSRSWTSSGPTASSSWFPECQVGSSPEVSASLISLSKKIRSINQCWCLLLTSMWQEILTDQGHRFRMFVLGFREIWYFTIPYNLDSAELAYHGNTGILETTDIFIYSVSQHKEISNNCRAWLACRNWGHLFLLKQTELSEKYPKVIMNFTN